jgi:uncharacterized protein
LITFEADDYGPWMSKFYAVQAELSHLLGRKVDLIDKRGIEQSRNWLKRTAILETAKIIYES